MLPVLEKDTAVTHLARYEEDGYYCDARHGDTFVTGGFRVWSLGFTV